MYLNSERVKKLVIKMISQLERGKYNSIRRLNRFYSKIFPYEDPLDEIDYQLSLAWQSVVIASNFPKDAQSSIADARLRLSQLEEQ